MKPKLDDKNVPVFENGMPVYVYADGTEKPFDAPGACEHISKLNQENAGFRTKSKEMEVKLARFGDTTPEDVEEMRRKVKSKKDGEVDVKAEIEAAKADLERSFKEAEIALKGQLDAANSQVDGLLIDNAFDSCEFIKAKIRTDVPLSMLKSQFHNNLKVVRENGQARVIPHINGENIMSKTNPGHVADMEEGIEAIINAFGEKDKLLSSGRGGSGGITGESGVSVEKTSREKIRDGIKARKSGQYVANPVLD